MSIRSAVRTFAYPLVAFMAGGLLATTAAAQSDSAARLATFSQPDGATSFALSVLPDVDTPPTEGRSIAVLVDTSASQAGIYREDSMAALLSVLNHLDNKDRVQIFAADLDAIALSDPQVPAKSPAVEQSLAKLQARAPLGSTDMAVILGKAADALADTPLSARRIVYIGDGISKASLLEKSKFAALVDRLVTEQISVSSLAIGPRRNIELLAALANQTGGNVIIDTNRVSSQQAGVTLAKSTRTSVVWPQTVQLPAAIIESFPAKFPPLRSDRDSILIGTLSSTEPASLSMTAAVEGHIVKLEWSLRPESSNEDFSHLPKLLEIARADNGVSLPTAGSSAMREVRRMLIAGADSLSKLGGRALASGDVKGAAALADAALANDPSNPQAGVIRDAVKRQTDKVDTKFMQFESTIEGDAPLVLEGEPRIEAPVEGTLPDGAVGDAPRAFQDENGRFLDEVEQRRKAREELLQVEVRTGISSGRDLMGVDPNGAVSQLKLLLETVRRSTDVSADIRAQLADQIESAVRSGMRYSLEKSRRDAQIAQNQAQANNRLRIAEGLERREVRLRQIMDRFDALMKDGNYVEAQEVAFEAEKLEPELVPPQVAIYVAEAGFHVYDNERIRDLAARRAWQTWQLVDESKIPFPDEPPLVYPPREFWEELTVNRAKYASLDLASPGSAEEKIFAELDKFTSVDFIDTPMQDAIVVIKEKHNDINIVIDVAAIDLAGINPEDPINMTLHDVTLRSALRLILKEFDLTYVVEDEVLQVTTIEEAEQQLVTKVYPVGDLVMPIVNNGGIGLGGGIGGALNGGGGGGLGGGGGGFGGGGGGFGGGGGGFGGGGGGFGGGGFGGLGGGGGGFFAVPEEKLLLGEKSTKTLSTSATTTKPEASVTPVQAKPGQAITLDLTNTTAAEAWQKFFAEQSHAPENQQVTESDIRVTVVRRMKSGQFDEVTVIIQSALANNFAQSWMYEALGLAMQAAGQPKSEIERAIMSAVDLAENMDEVFYSATYLSRIGLEERSLSLLRQVVDANPTRPEPLALALKIAKRTDNLPAIRWSSVGVLSHAWPHDQQAIENEARRIAKATLVKMVKDGDPAAEQFRSDLNAALVRDCVINVTWTGDADIDILVQEPSGTVCSLRNSRTNAGGVLLGDTSSISAEKSSEAITESYVCPQGFSGEYKLMVRPIWGQVAAGKVNVEVTTHAGTKGAQMISRPVELDDEPSLVVFNLADGRRTEPLADHVIQNTVDNQVAMSRAVLAQAISSGGASQTLQNLAFDRALLRNGLLRPAVGFRPVITALPEGTNMSTTAVVSADRRYVRISPNPVFSGVTRIETFNFVTGDTGDGGTGTGGGGGTGTGGGLGG